MSHRPHLIFSTRRLIAARCDTCFKLVAIYEEDSACPGCLAVGGLWTSQRRCRCPGTPSLPQGNELDALIERARRMQPSPGGRAPVRVRVTCSRAASG